MLLFAAQRKFKGVAKDWINAQRVSVMGKFSMARTLLTMNVNSCSYLLLSRESLQAKQHSSFTHQATVQHATSARTDQHASTSKVKSYNCNKHGHITVKCLHYPKEQRCSKCSIAQLTLR
ncbi:unnamed protein product [Ceratitis capitata]|uniref:(Mediterranean fruit fly) hypothetical protein n=1 Tax=Ceratitis capitata TaxID=7213 RepID=A0A811UPT8_CERCA|nr:unnamed protein product [Ceratitis capitata]